MFSAKLRKLIYTCVMVEGVFAALAPRKTLALAVRLWGFPFENPGDLEPTDWYVRSLRASGVGMIATGGVGLLLEDRAQSRAERAAEADSDAEADDSETVAVDD